MAGGKAIKKARVVTQATRRSQRDKLLCEHCGQTLARQTWEEHRDKHTDPETGDWLHDPRYASRPRNPSHYADLVFRSLADEHLRREEVRVTEEARVAVPSEFAELDAARELLLQQLPEDGDHAGSNINLRDDEDSAGEQSDTDTEPEQTPSVPFEELTDYICSAIEAVNCSGSVLCHCVHVGVQLSCPTVCI